MTDDKVLEQLEAIRRSAKANMIMEQNKVMQIANDNEFYDLVVAMDDGRYSELLPQIPLDGEIEYEVQ